MEGRKRFPLTWKIRITISLVIISEIRLTGNKILKLINAWLCAKCEILVLVTINARAEHGR